MKGKTTIAFLFSMILNFTVVNGQTQMFLEFKNGDKLEAEIKAFHSIDKKIKYKNLETGKKEKVASDQLESIIYMNSDDTLIFKRMKLKFYGGFGKLKESKKLAWVAKLYGTDKMEGYLYSASDYSFSANGLGGTRTNTFLSSAQAIKLASEDYVFFIGLTEIEGIGGKKTARTLMNRILKKYLNDFCPTFSEKMDKKSYEVTELKKLIDDYTAQCN